MERCQFSGSFTLISHHPTQGSGNSGPSVWSGVSTLKPHIWECPLLQPPSFPPISSGMRTEPSCHDTAISLSQLKQDTVTAPFVTGRAGHSDNLRNPTLGAVLSLAWLHTG